MIQGSQTCVVLTLEDLFGVTSGNDCKEKTQEVILKGELPE